MRPFGRGVTGQGAGILELTALNLALNGKDCLAVRRRIGMSLTGAVAGRQRRTEKRAGQPYHSHPSNRAPPSEPGNQLDTPLF